MRTDTIFYQLFQTLPDLLFELIGESPSVANSYQFSSKEVKELAFRFDGVYLPPAKDLNKFIYFVEVQFQKKKIFTGTCLEKYLYISSNIDRDKTGTRLQFLRKKFRYW